MAAWLARIGAYLGPMILEFVWGKLKRYLDERKARREEAKSQKETATAYKEAVANPDATREERKNAEDDYLNGVAPKPKSDS